MTKTFDRACYELAEKFLQDAPEQNTESNRDDLASQIQEAVEVWFADKR